MRIWNRETYHALKAAGVCVRCGTRAAIPGMTTCDPCGEAKAEQNRKGAARALEAGFCPRHRTARIVPGWKSCILCIANERHRKHKAHKAEKICPCP